MHGVQLAFACHPVRPVLHVNTELLLDGEGVGCELETGRRCLAGLQVHDHQVTLRVLEHSVNVALEHDATWDGDVDGEFDGGCSVWCDPDVHCWVLESPLVVRLNHPRSLHTPPCAVFLVGHGLSGPSTCTPFLAFAGNDGLCHGLFERL